MSNLDSINNILLHYKLKILDRNFWNENMHLRQESTFAKYVCIHNCLLNSEFNQILLYKVSHPHCIRLILNDYNKIKKQSS